MSELSKNVDIAFREAVRYRMSVLEELNKLITPPNPDAKQEE